ncbi:MAG TPA: DUF1801 domain-containing protein [Pyrinomonadaceae bacterium]|jgi:Uncharacterized conserved protein|nr:DUF1801 domain-containing protein [Pyrinomonadaceae bacterium]
MKKNAAKTIDEYLAGVRAEDHRKALEKLRKQIRAAAPKAEECISYQLPAFRQNGMLVFFGDAAKHCSFYPGSTAIETHQDELKDYELSKGTIRFQPNKPLPAALVRAIVKERLAENQRKAKKRR